MKINNIIKSSEFPILIAMVVGVLAGLTRTKLIASHFPVYVSGEIGLLSMCIGLLGTVAIWSSWVSGSRAVILDRQRSPFFAEVGVAAVVGLSLIGTLAVVAVVVVVPASVLLHFGLIGATVGREHLIVAAASAGICNAASIVWRSGGSPYRYLIWMGSGALGSVLLTTLSTTLSKPSFAAWGTVAAFLIPAAAFLISNLRRCISVPSEGVRRIIALSLSVAKGGTANLLGYSFRQIGDLAIRVSVVGIIGASANGWVQPYFLVVGVLIPQINAVVMPRLIGSVLGEESTTGDSGTRVWIHSMWLQSLALVFVAVFSPSIIQVLFGSEFTNGTELLTLGSLAEFLRINAATFLTLMQARVRNIGAATALMAGAVVRVFVTIAFLPSLGITALAVGAALEGIVLLSIGLCFGWHGVVSTSFKKVLVVSQGAGVIILILCGVLFWLLPIA